MLSCLLILQHIDFPQNPFHLPFFATCRKCLEQVRETRSLQDRCSPKLTIFGPLNGWSVGPNRELLADSEEEFPKTRVFDADFLFWHLFIGLAV